jgi:hypothetical protein
MALFAFPVVIAQVSSYIKSGMSRGTPVLIHGVVTDHPDSLSSSIRTSLFDIAAALMQLSVFHHERGVIFCRSTPHAWLVRNHRHVTEAKGTETIVQLRSGQKDRE